MKVKLSIKDLELLITILESCKSFPEGRYNHATKLYQHLYKKLKNNKKGI